MNGIAWTKFEKSGYDTVVIVASGVSLRGVDLELLRSKKCYVIAVNGAASAVPFANCWFTLDPWGLNGPQLPVNFEGEMWAGVPEDYATAHARANNHRVSPDKRIKFVHRIAGNNFTDQSSDMSYKLGLCEDKDCISTGNSGYGAINLAYHMRPKRIVLLGLDAGLGYFYTTKTTNRPLNTLPLLCKSAEKQLSDAGIQVLNGSQISRILCWPRSSPLDAIRSIDDN
jgi:hypothetical protein